jgi:hypothetical protein
MSEIVVGPSPTPERARVVTFVEPDWGDAAEWAATLFPVDGAPTSNLLTRQPSQVAGYDLSLGDGVVAIEGALDAAAPLDAVCIPYATATPDATWRIQVGDTTGEAAGENLADATGNGHLAVAHGAAVFGPGKFGSGVVFGNGDHADDYVATALSIAAADSSGTYTMWVEPALVGDAVRGLFQHALAGDNARSARILTNGTVQMGDGPDAVSTSALVSGVKTHLAFVFIGGDVSQLYVDGELEAEVTGEYPSVTGTGVITIGNIESTAVGFAGMVDDFRFYSRAMTEAEIQADMQSETPTDEGGGQIELQYKFNGYDSGTLTFGAAPNLAAYVRRCGWHLLPYQLEAKVVRITITDTDLATPLYLGRLVVGTAYQPPFNFDYGFRLGLLDDTKKTRTPSSQTTTNARVPIPFVEFTIRHLNRSAIMLHLYELQRRYGTAQPFVVCCDPEDEDSLQMLTIYGLADDLQPFPWVYGDGWESSWRVEAML